MSHSNFTKSGQREEVPPDTKVLDPIGRALKAHYDDLVKAPLPDRFLDLLSDLEEEERRSEAHKGDVNASR